MSTLTRASTRFRLTLCAALLALLAACAPAVRVTPVSELSQMSVSELPQTSAQGEIAVYTAFAEVERPYRELANLSASRYETDFSEAWLRERIVAEAQALGADAVVLFNTERSTELRPVRIGYESVDTPFGNDAESLRLGRGQGYQEVVTLRLRGVAIQYLDN